MASFTGWSPENHVGETPTITAPKYAVLDYLQKNNVNPATNWAQSAADGLNKQMGTQQFQALDGETLGYGDEYVHSAPDGYGQPGYTGNGQGPKTSFFWGSQGPSQPSALPASAMGAGTGTTGPGGMTPAALAALVGTLSGGSQTPAPANPFTPILTGPSIQGPAAPVPPSSFSNPGGFANSQTGAPVPGAAPVNVNSIVQQALMRAMLGS